MGLSPMMTVLSDNHIFRAIVWQTDCGCSTDFERFNGLEWILISRKTAIPLPFHAALDVAHFVVNNKFEPPDFSNVIAPVFGNN